MICHLGIDLRAEAAEKLLFFLGDAEFVVARGDRIIVRGSTLSTLSAELDATAPDGITILASGSIDLISEPLDFTANYADTYFRNGTYPVPLPSGMGVEAAGVVEAVERVGGHGDFL